MTDALPSISIVMPTYNQEGFILRAVQSVFAQTVTDWELIIIDDGSTQDILPLIRDCLADGRVKVHRFEQNRGMGAALNAGVNLARGEFIAYLPSDDLYYSDHLASLRETLLSNPDAALAFSGVRHHYNRNAAGQIDGYWLQLVQVMHRPTQERWTEREALVSDDLGLLLWDKLHATGKFIGTGQITCEWVDHPAQLHKLIREPEGGINPFRVKFNIRHPLRFHTTVGNPIDEVRHYQHFRERPDTPADGLKIVLVGELAYNAERVLALEERGHKLYGLWMRDPYWYNTVGPLPFGHVQDIPYINWVEELKRIQPDVIYALLNWQAVPFVHEILTHNPGIPFVWHFKEGPFICLEKGHGPN